MVLTAEELKLNYYFACLQIAGIPYRYDRSDIKIRDLGALFTPNPYIYYWNVTNIPMPTDGEMMANVTMAQINAIKAAM